MNKKDTEKFKLMLEKEQKILEEELSTIGKPNSKNKNSWEATSEKSNDTADENEVADKMEELEDNEGILQQLEKQMLDVKKALLEVENGTYGTCEICGSAIEKDRLEANPSARTCIKDMK